MTARKDLPQSSGDAPETMVQVLTGAAQFIVVQRRPVWQPPTDVVEFEDRVLVIIEIAGMKPEEFVVSLVNQRLVVTGERGRLELGQGRAAYHQLEVRYGLFRSEVLLPWAVDEEHTRATYLDGLLTIEIPRTRGQRVHVVEVNK